MRLKKILLPLLLSSATLMISQETLATPAFARQLNANCMACHNQSLPMLNAFGRQFKLTGYTLTAGDKSMITSGNLGMAAPVAINAGVGVKSTSLSTTQKDNTGATMPGQLAIPAGAAIMIGGKVGKDMGAHTLWSSDGLVHYQTTLSKPISAGNVGLSMFGSMGHGTFIAIESHNTGLHKELAMFDNSGRTNAVQAVGMGLGKGPSSGLVAFYGGNGLTVAAGIRALGFNSTFANGPMASDGMGGTLYRITYDAPAIAGWNLSVGAFGVGGTTTGSTGNLMENMPVGFASAPWYTAGGLTAAQAAAKIYDFTITSNGIDLQLQGSIAGFDTQVLLTQVAGYEFSMTDTTTNIERKLADLSTSSVEAQVMLNPAWGMRLGQMNYTDNADSTKDFKTTSVGVNYNYADNVRISLEQCNVDLSPAAAKDYTETLITTIVAF